MGKNQGHSKATPARLLALCLTREVRVRKAYLRELVDTARKKNELADEEFAFAQVLAFGVVMCLGTLDELIDRNLRNPHDVKAKVRDALRISAYELLFLNKPAYVVVYQGVELAKSITSHAVGLANAVLRKMVRDAESFPWGDPLDDTAAFSRTFGVPCWLGQTLLAHYGREQAASILRVSLEPAPTYLVDISFAAILPNHEKELLSDLQNEHLQSSSARAKTAPCRIACDKAAQHVAALVPSGGCVLEIGAGRGTKTILLQKNALERCGVPETIHTVDLHAYRSKLLAKRMEQLGVPNVWTHTGNACNLSSIEELPAVFDTVFIDAPCSGTGTLRRHPEIRWRSKPSDIDSLAQLQLALLGGAAKRVKLDGHLVYATCSILPAENENIVDEFLASTQGKRFSEEKRFSSLPRSGGPDGHFAVSLRATSCN